MFLFVIVAMLAVACKGGGVAGGYRIQQDNNLFGEGAEKFELDIKDDKSFTLTAGSLTMGAGTWSAQGDTVTMNWTSGAFGAIGSGITYKATDGKLVPMKGSEEVKGWRFVRR